MFGNLLFILIVAAFWVYIKFSIVAVAWAYNKFSEDRLRKYEDSAGLEKASLAYASDYQKVRNLILPTRQTAFKKSEPVIWLYRNDNLELFMGANWRNDVRIWLQSRTVLKDVHIVLDGTLNNSMHSNLKKDKLPKQQVELEGSFSKHFKLYCNKGQQVIALQIIAPDIMAYILDNLLNADIEIVDSQVAIIIKGGAKTLDRLNASIKLVEQIDKLTRATAKVTKL